MPVTVTPIHATLFTQVSRLGLNVSSPTNINLDSAYVWNSSGDAYAYPFQVIESGNLTDIWVAVISFTGTWASTDGQINWEIREGWGVTNQPGATLVSSGTITLSGSESTEWVKASGLSVSLTAGKVYWLIIGDADGSAANYVTMRRDVRNAGDNSSAGATTTDGWASVRSSTSYPVAFAVKVGGRMYGGTPTLGTATNLTSGTYARGVSITPRERMVLVGVGVVTQNSLMWQVTPWIVKLFADGQLPGDTPLKQWTFVAQVSAAATPSPAAYFFAESDQYVLRKNSRYRLVLVPPINSTVPQKFTNYANMDDDLRALISGSYALIHHTEESGGAWADDTDSMSQFAPIVAIGGLPTVVG